jgi:iron(III) transport system permease protein
MRPTGDALPDAMPMPPSSGAATSKRSTVAGFFADPWHVMALVAIGFLLLFVALPLGELVRQSFVGQRSNAIGFENFQTFFGSRYFRRALANSLTVGILGTSIALLVGVPLALAFARFEFAGKRAFEIAILLSMLSPPFVGAYAWILLFGRSGIVTRFFLDFGIDPPTIYGPVGISLAVAFGLYPIVFLIVRSGLSRIDRSLEEAAANLGRGRLYVTFSVTLPVLAPALVTSALLVFLNIISDFGTPSILGEGERYPVLATLAFSLFLSEIGAETGMAATTSVVLIAISLALVLAARRLARRRVVANDVGAATAAQPVQGLAGFGVALGVGALVAVANMPILVVVVSSFLEVRGVVFQPVATFGNFAKAWATMGDALWNSLVYAGIALVGVVVAGSLIGYFTARRDGQVARALDLLVMVPYVVPGTVLGIGYASVFNDAPLYLTGTSTVLVLMYFTRRLPYMTRATSSVVYQIDRSLEEASLNLGAPPLAGFRRIMAPLMRPGILAGASIAWVEIFNELSASIVLYTAGTRTLPVAAYQQSLGGDVGVAAAYGTMLIAVTALALALFAAASGRGRAGDAGWL